MSCACFDRVERTPALAIGAGQAFGRGRIEFEAFEGDVIAAILAISVFVFVDPVQRSKDPASANGAASGGCLCHCLLLHGVHAAQSADGLLVERDSFPRFGTRFIILIKGLQLVVKSPL